MSVTAVALLGAGIVGAQSISGNVNTSSAGTNNRPGFAQNLTDSQKTALDQARALFQAGNKAEAEALLAANGIQKPMGGRGHGGEHGKNMQAIEAAIIAGDYATFQTIASTSPLKSISQDTFNQLTPQFVAKRNAEEKIRSILSSAGITMPDKGMGRQATTTIK